MPQPGQPRQPAQSIQNEAVRDEEEEEEARGVPLRIDFDVFTQNEALERKLRRMACEGSLVRSRMPAHPVQPEVFGGGYFFKKCAKRFSRFCENNLFCTT